jgi:anti-sigma factor RsiW
MNLEGLSCRARVKLMCDYLDQELPPSRRKLVAAHRRSCLPCRELLASLTRTAQLLRNLKGASSTPVSARRRLHGLLRAVRNPTVAGSSRKSRRRR